MMRWIAHSSVRFLIVGLANTLVGLSVIYLAKWILALGDVAANILGYGAGLTLSFVLNKKWTFRYGGAARIPLVKFLLVFLLAYLINLMTVLVAIDRLAVNSYVAQAIGIVPYTLLTYLASKYYVFGGRKSDATRRIPVR